MWRDGPGDGKAPEERQVRLAQLPDRYLQCAGEHQEIGGERYQDSSAEEPKRRTWHAPVSNQKKRDRHAHHSVHQSPDGDQLLMAERKQGNRQRIIRLA